MGERTEQRDRYDDSLSVDVDPDPNAEVGVGPDVDPGVGPTDRTAAAEEATVTDRLRARLASPFGGLFSVRLFAVFLALSAAAMVLAGGVPVPGAGYLGVAAVAFAVGLAGERRRYLELLSAGAAVSAAATVFGNLLLTVGLGVPVALVGATGGGLAAVVGHYLGRDLRDGLTREL